jgi:protein-tyrosine-phosphatase
VLLTGCDDGTREHRAAREERLLQLAEGSMSGSPQHVLFLCTGNSARSILAEALMNTLGADRFSAMSAGSHPTGTVNRFAIELLQKNRLPTAGLHSKNWDEFAAPGAPPLDFVFTVCDSAAGEICPIWPGQPITAHWGVEDPAAVTGDDETKRRAFLRAYTTLRRRIELFLALPHGKLDKLALKRRLEDIGRSGSTAEAA